MTVPGLVLDLFPGIGLLARAFEQEGFCVVSGPDLIFGGDVRVFHPPSGVFEGIIGGPPCQAFSRMRHLQKLSGVRAGNLIPEFERIVDEASPEWFLMENVRDAPLPVVTGYRVHDQIFNNRWAPDAPEQNRIRRISFGTRDGCPLSIPIAALENPQWQPAVLANGLYPAVVSGTQYRKGERVGQMPDRRSNKGLSIAIELQGLPAGFLEHSPFTVEGKFMVVGNGVPLPMGRAIAAAVRRAMTSAEELEAAS